MRDIEKWEELANSYSKYFRFARSMESGLPVLTALEFLSNGELSDFAALFNNIADLIDEKKVKSGSEEEDAAEKIRIDDCKKNIRKIINSFKESERKEMIVIALRGVSILPNISSEKDVRPHVVSKSPRYRT